MRALPRQLFIFSLIVLAYSAPAWCGGKKDCVIALAKLDAKMLRLIPSEIALPRRNAELKALVQVGTKEFAEKFYSEFVTEKIIYMASPENQDWEKSEIRALIQARKVGQIPRALYRLLSLEGEVPEGFDEFMRRFGKALDRTRKSQFHKVPPQALKALKHIKLGALEHSLTDPIDVRLKCFRNNLRRTVIRILDLSRAKQITRRDYHELRKKVRDLKILFYLLSKISPTNDSLNLFLILEHIDDRLGDTKDDLKEIEEEYGDKLEGELITRVSKDDRELLVPLMLSILRSSED